MRAAPPVEACAVLRGGWWVAAAGLWLACAMCFVGWLVWHACMAGVGGVSVTWSLMLPIMLLAGGTLAAAATLLWHAHQEPMRLSWTGSHWVCMAWADAGSGAPVDGSVGGVDLMLDFGDAMLLRWRAWPPDTRHAMWLPVSRSLQPGSWHALRVALNLPTLAPEPGARTGAHT